MERKAIESALDGSKWKRDTFGNYKLEREGRKLLRIKMQATSLRIEVQSIVEATQYSPKARLWTRIGGCRYSQVVQLEDGRIRIGSYVVGHAH